jgi:hypothetical protein
VSTLPKSTFLHIKLAGGATAQCLGLMNAIYASNKLRIPFKVSYSPFSTGTYWPFAIGDLLEKDEILNINTPTKGLDSSKEFEIGKIIQSHPLMSKKISYEKLLSIIRKLNLEPGLQFLRREMAVLASPNRLININNYYRSISGGFAAINELEVNQSLHERFIKSGKKSPFAKTTTEKKLIVLHYRLGDKKAAGRHPGDFNSDLVIDPQSYLEVLSKIPKLNLENLFVVSDEPKLAQRLLSDVKVNARINSNSGDIWDDIFFMSQADVFIGSRSQVSQLANICVEHNGGISYMFNTSQNSHYHKFKNTFNIESKFLDVSNEIYDLNFKLEENSHSAYPRK